VVVGDLAAKRDLDLDRSVTRDFEEARFVAGFGQHDVAVVEQDGRVHLGLGALVFPDDFLVARHFDDRAAGIGLGLREGEEQIAVGQYLSVAGHGRVLPARLAGGVDDLGQAAEHQEGAVGGGKREGRADEAEEGADHLISW
jgi:hypothetical protein